MNTWIIIAIIIMVAFVVVACGGGSSSGSTNSSPNPPSLPFRTDILYGFYSSDDDPNMIENPANPAIPNSIAETYKFVNVVMPGHWKGEQEIIADSKQAIANGNTQLVIPLLYYYDDASGQYVGVENLLNDLRNAGILQHVVALYVYDEPNVNKPKNLTNALALLRTSLSQMADTKNLKFMTVYGPYTFGLDGIESFDWVGYDNYASHTAALSEIDTYVRPLLNKDQKLVLVPGGTAPWNDDPQPFADYANTHNDVVMIMPFIWFAVDANTPGIRNSPRKQDYINIGYKLTGRTVY